MGRFTGLIRANSLLMVAAVSGTLGLLGFGGLRSLTVDAALRISLSVSLLVLTVLGADLVNFTTDLDEDFFSHQRRATVSGAASPLVVASIAIYLWLGVILVSALLEPPVYTAFLIGTVFTAAIYSLPPKTKDHLLGSFGMGLPRAVFGPITAFLGGGGALFSPVLWEGFPIIAALVFLANAARDLADREADTLAGVRTIASVFGERIGVLYSLTGFYLAASLVVLLGLYQSNPLLLSLWVFAVVATYFAARKKWRPMYLTFYSELPVFCALYALPWLLR